MRANFKFTIGFWLIPRPHSCYARYRRPNDPTRHGHCIIPMGKMCPIGLVPNGYKNGLGDAVIQTFFGIVKTYKNTDQKVYLNFQLLFINRL